MKSVRSIYSVYPFLHRLTIEELSRLYHADYRYLNNIQYNPIKSEIEHRLKYIINTYLLSFTEKDSYYSLNLSVNYDSKYIRDIFPIVYGLFTKCMKEEQREHIYTEQLTFGRNGEYINFEVDKKLYFDTYAHVYDTFMEKNINVHKIIMFCSPIGFIHSQRELQLILDKLENEQSYSSIIIEYKIENNKLIVDIHFKLFKHDLYVTLDNDRCNLGQFNLLNYIRDNKLYKKR